jgi:hypothetical protein
MFRRVKLIEDKGNESEIIRGYIHLAPEGLPVSVLLFYVPRSAVGNKNRLNILPRQVQEFRF